MLYKWQLGKGAVKPLEPYAVTQWFYQLYSLYYQDVLKNLIWYLDAFQGIFERGLVVKGYD